MVCRYVDNYLVISMGEDLVCADDLRQVFSDALPMEFTVEEPTEGKIRYLDSGPNVGFPHLGWMYSARSERGYSPFSSSHSKFVKGVVAFCSLMAWRRLSNVS